MKEEMLKIIHQRFEVFSENIYPQNALADRLDLAKLALTKINANYKAKEVRGRDRLYLYDEDGSFILRYNKDFYPNNTPFGFRVCNDKFLTEKFLTYGQVSTTRSKLFTLHEHEEALDYIGTIEEPFVVKPLNMSGGEGVYINTTKDNFNYAWSECIKVQRKKGEKIPTPTMIIQNQVSGLEVRFLVTEGHLISATLRVPSFVIGDGTRTIRELIERKNKGRKKNPYFKKNLIKITEQLERILREKNLSLDDILNEGRYCVLYPQSNVASGGETAEVTDIIHPNVKQLALDAVQAIPGLHTSGVDIMMEHLEASEATIIEVNKSPHVQLNYYPAIGKPQQPLEYIFESIYLDDKVLNDKIKLDDMDERIFGLMKDRYKFLFEKDKKQEKIIKQLTEENEKLKKELNKTEWKSK